jgi:predicted O-methyltransferase YrrM
MVFVACRETGNEIQGAEIGVLDGVHAENMLTHLPGLQHLYLIEPDIRTLTRDKLKSFGDRKTWINKKFGDCTEEDIGEVLDFIYIDGDHSYKGVQIDLEQASKFVKPHGVICGHDFQMQGVERAVREYCEDNDRLLEIWGGEWWFVNAPMVEAKLDRPRRPPDI